MASNNTAYKEERKVCFGILQHQRWTTNSTVSLCDSMDLLMVGSTLRRTMNWDQNNLGVLDADVYAWHDKLIVTAKGSIVKVYSLEGILAGDQQETAQIGSGSFNVAELDIDGPTSTMDNMSVQSLCFCVAAKPHEDWVRQEQYARETLLGTNNNEQECRQIGQDYSYLLDNDGDPNWSTAKKHADGDDLKPMESNDDDPPDLIAVQQVMPTNQSRLSMLAVVTSQRLYLCAYGCFPLILSLPLPHSRSPHAIVMSHDLAHTIVTADHRLVIHSIPSLSYYRNDLQVLASHYPRIFAILESMEAVIPEIASSWKIALKAINLKLDVLIKLLRKYGCLQESDKDERYVLAPLLVRYITLGAKSQEIGNAFDQFLTGAQMNDQLMIRMERSLTSAISNIQESVQTKIVEPSRQLIRECQTLWGLTTTSELFSPCHELANSLLESSFAIWTAAQTCQAQLERDQKRVREDWLPWLRSAAAQTKAQGTAAQSVQHQTAVKRRVGDPVVYRVVKYLKEGKQQQSIISDSDDRSLIEVMLNLNFSYTMQTETKFSVPDVVTRAQKWAKQLFLLPRSLFPSNNTVISLQSSAGLTSNLAPTAIVTRMDGNGQLFQGLFSKLPVRQWLVAATPLTHPDCLLINAIPLTSPDSSLQQQQQNGRDGSHPILGEQVLSCRLQFPQPIVDVSFYSDDGRRSFANPKETFGKEGDRQKLGVLLQSTIPMTNQDLSVDLWLFRYDDLPFEILPLKMGTASDIKTTTTAIVQTDQFRSFPIPVTPLLNTSEGSAGATTFFNGLSVTAWTRTVTLKRGQPLADRKASSMLLMNPPRAQLLMSGSRGVGAIHAATTTSGSTLEIFDLEEMEDESDGSDEGCVVDTSMDGE